jgi:hypothetical protein
MWDALFHAPRSEAIGLDFLPDWNQQVLVPRYGPICLGCLIEINSPYWSSLPKIRLDQFQNTMRDGQLRDLCFLQQIPPPGAIYRAKQRNQLFALFMREHVLDNGETIILNGRMHSGCYDHWQLSCLATQGQRSARVLAGSNVQYSARIGKSRIHEISTVAAREDAGTPAYKRLQGGLV